MKYVPINLRYFLNMELQKGGGGKEIVTVNYTLKTVRDVIKYWSNIEDINTELSKYKDINMQYINCLFAGFRHNIDNHHDIGWDNLTDSYYASKDKMTDDEIEIHLKENPVGFENGFIHHGYHRACAMIGRIISGKPYIPFYMDKDLIYDAPREKDGLVREYHPIHYLKYLNEIKIPMSEYIICQSGILPLMYIRYNSDIDIIISKDVRKQYFNNNQSFIRKDNVEIFEPNKSKFLKFGAKDDDDLINNYSVEIGGYKFLEPRFYFSRKNNITDRDKDDWSLIKIFFDMESYKGYPFNHITLEQWGLEYVK